MKKSLFKRAVASVCAVPFALTQCLITSYAADDVADASAVTIGNLLYVDPSADIQNENGEDIQRSQWNGFLASALNLAYSNTNGEAMQLDVSAVADAIIANAGAYSEVVSNLISKVAENDMTCVVDANGVITINAAVSNVVDTFTAGGNRTIGGALRDLAAEYGASELADVNFDSVVASGTFKIVVDGSKLDDGETTIPVSFAFAAEDGVDYSIVGMIEYAIEKFGELKEVAYAAVDAVDGIDKDAAYAEIDDSVAVYINYCNRALNGAARFASDSTNIHKEFETAEDAFAFIKNAAEYRNLPKASLLPESAADAFSRPITNTIYESVMNQLNAFVTVDIPADEFAATVDSLYDISVDITEGCFTLSASIEDAEQAQVIEAVKEVGRELNTEAEDGGSHKEITVKVDLDVINSANGGNVDIDIIRVLDLTDEVKVPAVTTSTLVSTAIVANPEVGFYLSYMDEFDTDQIGDVTIVEEYLVDTLVDEYTLGEPETVTVEKEVDAHFGAQTPQNTFIENNDKFDYAVQLYMTDENGDDVALEGVTATCYIGKKGDANLDNNVTPVDATAILTYYSMTSMGADVNLSQEDEMLDNFAAFLADVDADETADDYWMAKDKSERTLTPTDATNCLRAYSYISMAVAEDKALWDMLLNRA